MEHLTEKERTEIFMMIGYGDRRRGHAEVRDLFNELVQRIREETTNISGEFILNTVEGFSNRIYYCQETSGEQFEHGL